MTECFPRTPGEPAVAVLEEPDPVVDDSDDTPSIEGVCPALLPVGCNAYVHGGRREQYVWLRVDSLEDGPERAEDSWVGRRSAWFDEALDSVGWDYVLDLQQAHKLLSGDRTSPWLAYLLEEGVAPGQPFLARVRVTGHSDYWGEYDEDWEVEVVARAPRSAVETLAAWTSLGLFNYGYTVTPPLSLAYAEAAP